MINDPELKAMSEVHDALQGLDGDTQKRVVDWVLAKLKSPNTGSPPVSKRGPKLGNKRRKRGRKPGSATKVKVPSAKRGPKPGSKRGLKPGKRGRPAGSAKKTLGKSASKTGKRRGRPRKNPVASPE